MNSAQSIEQFLRLKRVAVAGVSRSGKGFGAVVYRDLVRRGLTVFPVNPNEGQIDGTTFVRSLLELQGRADGVVLVTPPKETERLVRDAREAGIINIWMQQGAESTAAIAYCNNNGMVLTHGECMLMFDGPAGFPHSFHRLIRKWTGTMPSVHSSQKS
jgi:predicted CoA-binding protein